MAPSTLFSIVRDDAQVTSLATPTEATEPSASDTPGSRATAWVLALIATSAALRIALALMLPLSVDEAYAAVMGRRLDLSYFDHPPMVFWWAGLATRLARSEAPLVVRLPFIVAFMATTWLVYQLGSYLFGSRAGLASAVLLNASLFLSVAAGGWALPDGPLLLFSAAAAYCLARATLAGSTAPLRSASVGAGHGRKVAWLGFGTCAGLALLSKYHGALLLAGAAAFLLTSRRQAVWLRRVEPYIATACTVVLFLPVLIWNSRHEWVSFRFQGARALSPVEPTGTPLLDTVAGQAVWILPWIWVPLLVALLVALRAGPRDARRWLLVCLGCGPVFGFTLLAALGSRGLPHWEAPGYFMLLPLLGALLVRSPGGSGTRPMRWLFAYGVLFLVVVLVMVTHARSGWMRTVAPQLFSRGDPTDDLLDWTPVAKELQRLGLTSRGFLIAGARWDDTAKMALQLGPSLEVTCVGEDARGFASLREPVFNVGRDVVLAVRRRPGPEPLYVYSRYFDGLRAVEAVPLRRGGRDEVVVSLYEGHNLRSPLPMLRRP